jgi:formylglycine-generating enzyme required for sulfatase activity
MRLVGMFVLAVVLVTACAPASTPTPTLLPSTPTTPPTDVPATATLALVAASLAGPQAGSSMLWMDGAELAYVPAGEFVMGNDQGNTPQKTIYVDPYWMYTTPVTNKMYTQCVATGNCAPPAQEVGSPVYSNPLYGDFPAVGVTWDMAANYCTWAQAQLPTEAQWEKAARGDDGAVYPWGISDPACDLLNFEGCLGHSSSVLDFQDGRSPYGMYDMAGNVFQWVNDIYDEHAYDSMAARNPTGPASGSSHVLRGSSYETEEVLLPSAVRHFGAAAYHSSELGFRCAVPEPKALAPYCQLSSYVPTGAGPSSSTCELPELGAQRNYCEGRRGFVTITIPDAATYRITTPGYDCSDAVVNGERLVTCAGPDLSSGKLTVCNPACSGAPSETGSPVVCDPGYNMDPSTSACIYAPIEREAGVSGCPAGYNLVQRGDSKICAAGLNQNGTCGLGTYYDGQYGACVSPSVGADAPYGISDPGLAAELYQGCAAGYTYDPAYQCCQAMTGAAYPGCPVGFAFDPEKTSCIPHQISVNSPGCMTVTLNIPRCALIPEDTCSVITNEALCKINQLCEWQERQGFCRPK